MRNNKSKIPKKAEPVDTLVIVGNGFDCWQGLDTDYGQFEKYYFENQDHILQKLGLKKSWSFVVSSQVKYTFFRQKVHTFKEGISPQECQFSQ